MYKNDRRRGGGVQKSFTKTDPNIRINFMGIDIMIKNNNSLYQYLKYN